jgi:RND family efflux transporter MFP subunit
MHYVLMARRLLRVVTLLPTLCLAQAAGAPVAVTEAVEGDLALALSLTGSVTASQDAQLSVATSGLVTRLLVDAGDRVESGDLLLELDSEMADYQYQAARASQQQARRALTDARRRLEEVQRLAPQQSIAETVVKDIQAEVAEDESALQQAAAETGYRRALLERHRLRAPFTGVISHRSVDLGEWLAPGSPVFGLVSTEGMRVDFQVPEDYLGQVAAGDVVSFTLGADRTRRYSGKVITAVPVTDPAVRTFLLRVVPDKALAGMLPGMSARGQLALATGRRGIIVPRDALLRYSDGRIIVWVITEQDGSTIASERRVSAGLNFDGQVEIVEGLSAGELVVVKGNESLRSGQVVAVQRED